MTRENVYNWRVRWNPGAPPTKEITLRMGSIRIQVELEEGDRNTQGEWLARKIGHTVPPLEECQEVRGGITHPREPAKLWEGAPRALPTIREKEHVLVFQVGSRTLVSKPVKCSFPYDLGEIMGHGHALLDSIPEEPILADFAVQPWQPRVEIRVKRFRSLWEMQAPFGKQEIEVEASETPDMVWRRLRMRNPNLPSFEEIGLTPRCLNPEMTVTIPRIEVEIVIGATISGQWIQAGTTTDWLRDPERLVQDCVRMLGAPPTLTGRFRIEGSLPWKQGDVLTAVELESLRPMQWSIPAKDGTRYIRRWMTQEYGKLSVRERGNWYEPAQLDGPEPPYSTEITSELRGRKTDAVKKQPRETRDQKALQGPQMPKKGAKAQGRQERKKGTTGADVIRERQEGAPK
jgi:hypothetical protein